MKLYELTSEYRQIMAEIEEAEGELTDELESRLSAIEADFNSKAESVAMMYRELIAESEAIKAEADRLLKRAKTLGNRGEWLREYLRNEMLGAGVKKVEGVVPVAIRQAPPSVIVDDEDAIPADFWCVEEVRKLDKKAIIDAWKTTGTDEPGVHVERKSYVKIG